MTLKAESRARLSTATWSSCFCHGLSGPRAVEHDARLAGVQPLGQGRLELPPGGEFPFFQVVLQPLAAEPSVQLLDSGSVLGVVRHECVVPIGPVAGHRDASVVDELDRVDEVRVDANRDRKGLPPGRRPQSRGVARTSDRVSRGLELFPA